MHKLSDTDKNQIKAEEIYRNEIRRDLETKSHVPQSKLWTFLNSSLGIWVLSSLLLAGITTAYSSWNNYETRKQENVELVNKLNEEITFRINLALDELSSTRGDVEKGTPYTAVSIYANIGVYLDNGYLATKQQDFSLLPQFKERTFASLLGQLYDMPEPDAQSGIKNAFYAYEEICNKGSQNTPADQPEQISDKEHALSAIQDISDTIKNRILLKQWTNGIW